MKIKAKQQPWTVPLKRMLEMDRMLREICKSPEEWLTELRKKEEEIRKRIIVYEALKQAEQDAKACQRALMKSARPKRAKKKV